MAGRWHGTVLSWSKPRVSPIAAAGCSIRSSWHGPSNTKELYEDGKKLAVVRAEKNITLLLEHRVNAVEVVDGRILAVIAQSKNVDKVLPNHALNWSAYKTAG
jgi:hypothetical protein